MATNGKAVDIRKKSVLLSLHIGRPGNRARVAAEDLGIESEGLDTDSLHIAKELLDSPELREIQRHDNRMRHHVILWTLPSPLRRGGLYVVPTAALLRIDAYIEKALAEREALIDAFIAAYDAPDGLVARARAKLGKLFKDADYPDSDRLRAAFTVEYLYHEIKIPDSLGAVSDVIMQREREKAEAAWEQVRSDVGAMLRAEALALCQALRDALGGTSANGNRRALHDSTIEKIRDFIERARIQNIVDDEGAAALVTDIENALGHATGDGIRSNNYVRMQMHQDFAAIARNAEALVRDLPMRRSMARRKTAAAA